MATTMYFEETLRDKGQSSADEIELEFGRSSFYGGISQIYINVDGKGVILNDEQGKKLYQAMVDLGRYLGYDRQ